MTQRLLEIPAFVTSRFRGRSRIRMRGIIPYLLIAPAFLVLGIVLIYPALYNIVLSLWEWRFTNPADRQFIFLNNYIHLITNDPVFWSVLRFTGTFVFLSLALEMILGVLSALLLYSIVHLRRTFLSFLLLPYMVAPIAVGLTWKLLWARDYGLINHLLSVVSVQPVNWLGDGSNAVWAVVIAEVWQSMPFVMLVLLAGLTSIPEELFDAAKVDGSSRLRTFWHITLPLLAPSLAVALIFQTVFKLRVFDLVLIMTGGGPGTDTLPLGILIHRTYFRYFNGGYAAAQSVVLLLIGALISALYLRLIYREIEY
jgi:ABC-type sugar transport system permease subunit